MPEHIRAGDCVRTPDGRIARVRDVQDRTYRVRVRRTTSKTHQFLRFESRQLKKVECPKGWMSPEGYNRYLKITLAKAKKRLGKAKR